MTDYPLKGLAPDPVAAEIAGMYRELRELEIQKTKTLALALRAIRGKLKSPKTPDRNEGLKGLDDLIALFDKDRT